MSGDQDEAPLPAEGDDVCIEGSGHGPLSSSVLRKHGDVLVLAPASRNGLRVPLEPGQRVRIDYVVDDVPCAVPGEAGDALRNGAAEADQVRLTGGSVRFQRRTDFRVPDLLPTRVHPVNAAGYEQGTVEGITENISATGALVRAAMRMSAGQGARVEIDTPDGGTLEASGICVRVGEARHGGTERVFAFSLDLNEYEEQQFRALVVSLQRRAIARIRDA